MTLYWGQRKNKACNIVDAAMKRAEQYLTNLQTNITEYSGYQYNCAQNEIEWLKQIIRESESQYKHLIERIKKL